MADLFALTYLSEETRSLLPEELDAILLDARMFNAAEHVSGVLFYGDGRFFQLLEGPEEGVTRTFERLSSAKSHKNLRVLSQGPTSARFFESWHMGFIRAPTTAMQELSQSAWEDAFPYTKSEVETSEGLGLLVYYWNKWSAEPIRSAP